MTSRAYFSLLNGRVQFFCPCLGCSEDEAGGPPYGLGMLWEWEDGHYTCAYCNEAVDITSPIHSGSLPANHPIAMWWRTKCAQASTSMA